MLFNSGIVLSFKICGSKRQICGIPYNLFSTCSENVSEVILEQESCRLKFDFLDIHVLLLSWQGGNSFGCEF